MNRELLSRAIGEIDGAFIAEAWRPAPEDASGSSERNTHMKTKRILALALAAALILSFSIVAYASYQAVATPQAAEKVAREQIAVWREMGILSPEAAVTGDAFRVIDVPEHTGSEYWYGRLFPHCYEVQWSMHPPGGDPGKYGFVLRVDTLSGKILSAVIMALPEESDTPVGEIELEYEQGRTQTAYFYDNYDDIFPADMTVDRFCGLLAEYWGFSGYTLADTVDEGMYNARWDAVDGSTLLLDLPKATEDNYYLTVFFEGDQEGVPMYISLGSFPGYVCLILGNSHPVG